MKRGFRLGKVLGIEIVIDVSWIYIFILVTLNLAVAVFPRIQPNWGTFLNWSAAVITSLLFFSSVLTHELAHSVVAKSRGLPVNKIVLFLFGGVSDIEREPPSPKTEFLTTIVGPLTSIFLGFIFILAGIMISGNGIFSSMQFFSTLFLWLGPVNILLGVFNLIPGFPLDGGRLFRSAFWAATGNFRTATRYARLSGLIVSWAFIIIGALMIFGINIPFFGTGTVGGLWVILIGWFLNAAARESS